MYMAGKLTVSSMICWKQTRRKRRGTRIFLTPRVGGCHLVHCPHQCLCLLFKALLEAGLGTRSSSSNGSWAARSATAVSISCLSLMRSWTSSSGAGVLLLCTRIQQAVKLLALRNRHRHVSHLFRNAFNYHHLEHRDVNILLYCVLQNGTSWSNASVHGSSCECDGNVFGNRSLLCVGHGDRWSNVIDHRSQRCVGHDGCGSNVFTGASASWVTSSTGTSSGFTGAGWTSSTATGGTKTTGAVSRIGVPVRQGEVG